MPDPKLKVAMDEVRAVLERHDVGAVIILASPTHMEHLLKIDPSWSCARLGEIAGGGYGVRVRAKRSEFPDAAAQKKCIEETVGMFAGFVTVLDRKKEDIGNVLAMLGQHFDIEHFDVNEGPRE